MVLEGLGGGWEMNSDNMKSTYLFMKASGVFNISGETIVTATILKGELFLGDKVKVVKINVEAKIRIDEFEATVKSMEQFRKPNLVHAKAIDNIAFKICEPEKFKIKKGIFFLIGKGEEDLEKLLEPKLI